MFRVSASVETEHERIDLPAGLSLAGMAGPSDSDLRQLVRDLEDAAASEEFEAEATKLLRYFDQTWAWHPVTQQERHAQRDVYRAARAFLVRNELT